RPFVNAIRVTPLRWRSSRVDVPGSGLRWPGPQQCVGLQALTARMHRHPRPPVGRCTQLHLPAGGAEHGTAVGTDLEARALETRRARSGPVAEEQHAARKPAL